MEIEVGDIVIKSNYKYLVFKIEEDAYIQDYNSPVSNHSPFNVQSRNEPKSKQKIFYWDGIFPGKKSVEEFGSYESGDYEIIKASEEVRNHFKNL
jgi:hypothetical protein